MSLIASILLDAAGKLLVPNIKKVLTSKMGEGGELMGDVIDIVADKAGVPKERLPSLPHDELERAVTAAEPLTAELLDRLNKSQALMNEAVALDYKKEPWWAWAWRPMWMWMLGVFWGYAILLQPLIKAAMFADLENPDLATLAAITSLFTAFYMGGHTVKQIFPISRGR